jgi:cytochrome-b5 reductase
MDLLVKAYPPCSEGDGFGAELCALKVGGRALFQVKDQRVNFPDLAKYGHIAMLGAGTGLAPLLQIARHVLEHPPSSPNVSLLMSYPKVGDVMLSTEIEELVAKSAGLFKYRQILTQETTTSSTSSSSDDDDDDSTQQRHKQRLSPSKIMDFFPPPSSTKTLILVCGTPQFVDAMGGPLSREPNDPITGKRGAKIQGPLRGLLRECGFEEHEVYKF